MATIAITGPVFGPLGYVVPSQPNTLSQMSANINIIFGGGLNPALDTPQGQLSTSLTAEVSNVWDQFGLLTNQMDPAFNTGRYQDGIARIYFLSRKGAQPTVVAALCTGLVGVPIPAGSLALALDGNFYTSTDDAEIGGDGTVTIQFACNAVGPIDCPEGSLNVIARAIPGWDSITNPADGVLGRNTESRREFEERRAESVAENSIGSPQAVKGAVLAIDGVLDAYVYNNNTNGSVVIGDYTLIANSIYVAAVGGSDQNVARAIFTKAGPGPSYNGNTSVAVADMTYDSPRPTYIVKFERPRALTCLFAIQMQNGPDVPADAGAQVQQAVIAAFAGADGGSRARIGGIIYASRFNAPISALGTWAQQIISIQIGSENNPDAAEFTGSIAANLLTVTATTFGTIAVGQTIIGPGVFDGTVITSQAGGTPGGIGTYNLAGTAQTVSSETMNGAIANQNMVDVEIDQAPVVTAGNISLTLVT